MNFRISRSHGKQWDDGMIRFFYESIVWAKQRKLFYWKALYKVNKVILNWIYPISQKNNKQIGVSKDGHMIVSLTTYPGRIDQVWKTIASLLNQTEKPKRVILWLSDEQFSDRKIPESVQKMVSRGLEICYCEDLKSHKKYFEVMKQYPDEIIVTADDDILYPENHLEKLWKSHLEFPNEVICQWSHKITFDKYGDFVPYNDWPDNGKEAPALATLAVGCGGILYPKGALSKEAFNEQELQRYALSADDLWLKCMELLVGIKTVNCNMTVLMYYNILSTRKSGLWVNNIGCQKNNDKIWQLLMKQYPEDLQRLKEEMGQE